VVRMTNLSTWHGLKCRKNILSLDNVIKKE
jgi:hypothetical protein